MALSYKDFAFLTEGGLDRVIYKSEGQTTVNGSLTFNVNTTGIAEAFLPHLSVSFDGNTWVADDSPSYANNSINTDLSVSAVSYPGLVRITIQTPNRNGTVYYRILGVKNDII